MISRIDATDPQGNGRRLRPGAVWRRRSGRVEVAALLAAVALVAAACSSSNGSSSSSNAESTPPAGTTVTDVSIAMAPGLQYAALFAAVNRGLFLKHGLNVKLLQLSSGAAIIQALAAGTAQFSTNSATSLPTARASGLESVAFVMTNGDATSDADDRPLALVVRADSGIKPGDWSSLVGKKVGFITGGTADQWFSAGLTKAGVSRSKVKILNVPVADQLTAIQRGSVDAIASWEPYGTNILMKMGSDAVLFQRGGGLTAFLQTISSTKSYIMQHPDLVQEATDAMAEAAAWTRANTDAAATGATQWISGLDTDVATAAIKNLQYDPRIGHCTQAAFNTSADNLVKQDKLKKKEDVTAEFDETFLAKTQQNYPQYFTDLQPIPSTCVHH